MSALYLDNAATSPVRPEVLAAMDPFLRGRFGNPSSHHTVGEDASRALEDARARVAAVLGMRPTEIVFTSGGTEANNLAIKGLVLGSATPGQPVGHIITSSIEHESVRQSLDYLARWHGATVTTVAVSSDGLLSPAAVAAAVREDTALVTVGYANNEVGTVQDVAALAAVASEARTPLHLDAVQAAGWLPLSRSETGADAITIAGHKIGAPKGIGVLGVRGRYRLEPVLHGGGQEREARSGTQNVAGAVGLAVALVHADRERDVAAAAATRARDDLIAGVLSRVPAARLTGHATRRLPGTTSFVFPGTSGEAVLLELERRGYVTSSGSACAAGSDEPSHVLLALGYDPDEARTAVRITLGHELSATPDAASIDALAAAVAASVDAVREPR